MGVVDAIIAGEGDAPIQGTPRHMGLILASENPVSCDAVAAHLIGVNPKTVGYLEIAGKQNLGEIDIKEIETNVNLQRHRKKFKLPSFIEYLYKNRIVRRQEYL